MQSNELLLKIQKEIETPKRDAFNDHGKYYYSSADEVFRVVRDVLMKHKVIFKCDEWKFEVRKTGSISSSKNNQITKRNVQTILIEFTMSLSDDEDVIIKGTYSLLCDLYRTTNSSSIKDLCDEVLVEIDIVYSDRGVRYGLGWSE